MSFPVGSLVRLDRRWWRAAVMTASLDTARVEVVGRLMRDETALVIDVVLGSGTPDIVRLLTSDGRIGWTSAVNLEVVP